MIFMALFCKRYLISLNIDLLHVSSMSLRTWLSAVRRFCVATDELLDETVVLPVAAAGVRPDAGFCGTLISMDENGCGR